MKRAALPILIVKALLARSGNQCAFPGCIQPVINEEHELVAQICHIEAVSPGGPRHNPNQPDRNLYDNLIILCGRHHKEVDGNQKYTAADLRKFKHDHEGSFLEDPFRVDMSLAYKVRREMEIFLEDANREHGKEDHPAGDLRLDLNATASFFELARAADEQMEFLSGLTQELDESDRRLGLDVREFLAGCGYDLARLEEIPYWKSPIENRHVDWHHLAFPNTLSKLQLLLLQMELRYLELHLTHHPNDLQAQDRLRSAKEEFMDWATSAGYLD